MPVRLLHAAFVRQTFHLVSWKADCPILHLGVLFSHVFDGLLWIRPIMSMPVLHFAEPFDEELSYSFEIQTQWNGCGRCPNLGL